MCCGKISNNSEIVLTTTLLWTNPHYTPHNIFAVVVLKVASWCPPLPMFTSTGWVKEWAVSLCFHWHLTIATLWTLSLHTSNKLPHVNYNVKNHVEHVSQFLFNKSSLIWGDHFITSLIISLYVLHPISVYVHMLSYSCNRSSLSLRAVTGLKCMF